MNTETWSRAYDQLLEIIKAKPQEVEHNTPLAKISIVLLRKSESSDSEFLAWLVACFVPWTKKLSVHHGQASDKKAPSAASNAAREGIKADNKLTKIIDDASSNCLDIIEMKNIALKSRKIDRVTQGWAIRRWGSYWRTSVLFALLTEIAETEIGESQ